MAVKALGRSVQNSFGSWCRGRAGVPAGGGGPAVPRLGHFCHSDITVGVAVGIAAAVPLPGAFPEAAPSPSPGTPAVCSALP